MKLFSKIATALVGMAMAIGVGVAVSSTKVGEVSASSTVTFTPGTDTGASSVTKDGVTATMTTMNNASYYQIYANESGTFSVASGNVTKIEFACTASGDAKYGPGNVTANVGTYSYDGVNGTWTGSSNSVTLSASKQVRMTSLSVTYESAVTSYTITYDANGGTGTMSDTTNTVAACTFTAPSGKVFSTWNTAADGSGTQYAPGATASSDLDLFAIWVDKPAVVTLDKIGTTLESTANTTMETVDITDGSDTYTLNYLQCKKQGDSMFMTKDVNPFISNHTEMPGAITSIEVFINSGASGKTTYDVAFGTSEYTTATAGIGAVNIAGGNSHVFENEDVDGATYFCITLGNANNGQVLKLVVNYEVPATNAKIVDTNGTDITSTFNIVEGYAPIVKYAEQDGTIIEGATWVAADSTVIQIMDHSSYVYLRGLKPGNTTVTASKSGYKTASISVQVTEDPTKPEMEIWDNTWKLDDGSGYWWSATADLYWFYAHPEGDTEREAEERTILSDVTWSSSDETVATITTQPGGQGSVTCLKPGETTLTATKSGYKSVSVIVAFNAGAVSELHISGSMSKTTYTTSESWDPSGFVVKAHHGNTGWEDVVTSEATWTYSPSAPAQGVTSVVATAHWNDGVDDYEVSSSAQAVIVTVQHAGTAEDPFTVVEALAKANEIGTVGKTGQGPWVTKGIISRVTSAPAATYWNATYYISDDGSQTNELQVYRGYYIDNAKFDAETAALLTAGKIVTVTGNLTGSYGCEYCQGNYLLSLESPSTGDIDVTFEPELNIEIGDTGTFTASTDATSPTYTWSVEDSSILSVDSSTGAFEGLKLGTTKVTVNVSATEGNGEASAFITVNGSGTYTIEEANEIAAAEASGSTTSYYIYVEGYVSLFNSDSQTAGNERALDITNYDQNESIMVFVGKSGYSTFISGLKLGDYIRVKAFVQNYSGKYELTTPTKVESYYTEMSFAYELLELTDAVCKDYDGVTDNKSKLETVWETLVDSSHYGALTSEQIENLVDCEASETGTTVQQAMARYDYLVVKYELDNFISDRTPSVGAVTQPTISNNNNINSSMSIIVVAVIAITSLSAIGVLLVIKRRKSI